MPAFAIAEAERAQQPIEEVTRDVAMIDFGRGFCDDQAVVV